MQVLAPGDHVTLEVTHSTRFTYSQAVSQSHNELRMSPADTALQKVLSHNITVSPEAELSCHSDHFGNLVHHFNILEPHDYLDITAQSRVQTTNAISCGPESSPDPRPYSERWVEYLSWSPGVPNLPEYATVSAGREISMAMDEEAFAESLYEMARYFFRSFRYDPDVTHVHSSPKELFANGGGVCQDMAHAMIGVLRKAGVPARYVSGYIFEPGKGDMGQHLRGSSATHAWVQAWHEGHGWVGIDPTNDKLVDWQYVRTAFGRDYFDVQPLRGVFVGGVEQTLAVDVHVHIVEDSTHHRHNTSA